jgi:transmembrane E3 ubiquitin-protein ligase
LAVPAHIQAQIKSIYSPPPNDEGQVSYYANITGIVRGKWTRIPEPNLNPFLPPEIPTTDEYDSPHTFPAPEEWGNFSYRDPITGLDGKFTLDISAMHQDDEGQFIEAAFGVAKETGDNVYTTRLHGIHFPRTGQIVLTSTSPKKFEGLTMLPFLTTTNDTFSTAQALIMSHLRTSIEKHQSYTAQQDEESTFFSRPLQCDIILFLAVLPSPIPPAELAAYEHEMRFPTGASVVSPGPLEVSGVAWSPDCGTALGWRDEAATKVERFWVAGRRVGIVAGVIAGVQVWWVLKEMGERGSPSVPPPPRDCFSCFGA